MGIEMNRHFLRILAGAAAAPAVTYFLPPIGGWKSSPAVDPLLFEYQRRLDEFCNQISGNLPVLLISNPTGPSWLKDQFMRRQEVFRAQRDRLFWQETQMLYWADEV